MSLTPDADLRALDLFERLVSYPNNPRFRARVLKGQTDAVLDRLAQLEAGHAARGAMPTEAVDAASTAVEEAPAKIGVYRLVEEVGRGGMGDVWRAERDDGLFEQTVAIKLIRTNLTAQALAAFDFERQVLAKLDHPNIVRLIDGGVTAGGRPYLIMDYVQGAPFDAAIAPLAFPQKIALFIQAASAAQFAHERLTAHGDLKPSNILIDADGRVRLLDFGVSELIVAEAPVRATPGAFTRDFASPQRRAGEPPSIADDVFALGRILEPIVAERPDQELLAVVRKASAPEVQDRYATVAALIADLENWRAGRPVGALPDRFVYRTRKFVSRHLAGVLATSLAATLLIAATILATAASLRAEHARAEASARFEDARGTARYLLFTLLDKLEAKPNTLSLRTEVAGVAQHYLDRLSHAAAAMPEVRLEAARGYLRLAEAQGVPGFQNLDEGALAQSNLEKALALLPDTRPEAVAEVAIRALIEEVHISTYINNDADTALRRLDRADGLAAAHPALPVQLRARLLAERADTLGWKLQWGPSIANAQAALKLLDGQTSLDAFMTRAYALETIAVGRGNLGDLAASVRGYQDEVELYDVAVRSFPGSRRLRRNAARARWQWGASDTDHPTVGALHQLTLASKDLRDLAAFDSDDADTRRIADYADADRATMLAKMGRLPQALVLIRGNIDRERSAWARHPNELQWLRDLAIDEGLLGAMLTEHGRPGDGCAALNTFMVQYDDLGRRGKLSNLSLSDAHAQAAAHQAKYCGGKALSSPSSAS